MIGNLAVDRDRRRARAGGGVYHATRAAALSGGRRRHALRSRRPRGPLLAPLEALGLPVKVRDATETTAFSFHYEGDHRVMTVDAVGDPWTSRTSRGGRLGRDRRPSWVLVAGLLRSHFPAPRRSGARRGRRLLLDAQGIVRPARTGPLQRDDRIDRAVLRHLAVPSS